MKLLFDQNLSYKLCPRLADIFPASNQAGLIGLANAVDINVWMYAKQNGFVLVSKDSDFADLAALYGSPPKLIWLRCGNQPTAIVEGILRDHIEAIIAFEKDATAACLEIL